jgi:hypothetical protein
MTPPVLAFDVELSTPIRSPITAIQDSPGESISRWATSTVRGGAGLSGGERSTELRGHCRILRDYEDPMKRLACVDEPGDECDHSEPR